MTTLKYSRSRASDKLIFIQFRQKALGNLLLPALLVISLTSVALAHQAEYQIEQLNQQSDQDPYGYAFAVDSEQSPFAGQQQINIGGSNFGNRPVAGARPNRPDFSSFGLRPTTTTSTTESPVQQQEQLQQQQQNEESDGQQQQQQQQLPGSGRPNLDLNGQQIVQQDDDSSSNGNEQTEGQTSDEGQQEQVNENEDTTGGLNQAQPTRAPSTSTGGSSRPGSSTFTSNGAGVSQRPTASRPINPSQGELQQIVNGGDAQQQSEDGQEGQQAGGNDESTGSNDGDEQQQQVVESTTTRRPILQRPSTSRRPVSFTTTTTTTSAPISQENEGQSFENNQTGGNLVDNNQEGQQEQQQDEEQQGNVLSSTTSTTTTSTTPAPISSTRAPTAVSGQQVKSLQQGATRSRVNQLPAKGRPVATPMAVAQQQQRQQAKTIEPTRAIPVQATKNSGTVARQQLPTATFIPGKGSRRPQSAFGAPAPAPSNLPTAVPFSSLSQQLQVMPAGLDQVNDGFSQPAPVAPVEGPQFIMIPMPVQQQVFEVPQEAILPQAGNDRASQLQQQILTGPIMEPTFQARPPKPITSGQQQQQASSIKSVPKPQTSSNLRATNAATKQGPRQLGWMNNLISNGANKPTGQSAGLQVQPSNLGSSNQSVKGNQQPSQSGQTTSGATKTSRTPSASNGGVSGAQASGPRAATKNQQSGLGAQPQSQSASQSVSPSRASTKGNSEQEAPRVPQSQLTGPREVKTSQQRQQSAATSGQVASSLKAPPRSSLPSKQARPTASGKTSTSGSSGPRFQPILSNNADNAQTTQGGLTSQTSEAATSENNGSFNGPSTSGEANQRPVVNGSGLGSSSATKGGRVQAKPSDGRQPVRMSPGAKSRLATKSLMAQQQQQQQLLIN